MVDLGSNPGRVIRKTIKLVFVASQPSTQHKGLYHGEKKLHFDEDDDDDVCFDLDQYTELDFYSASSLKQTVCR
jgi:hypothetical protein